ncbi:hypothetical protein [Caldibacillus debilis]|uniref:hypothetical protein n=1 Tax=Caldibacillus debilis TaxID=301148 RepID=UPI0011C3C3B4|nr:hypothetical protein [Caldibacillus debilis]
MPQTEFYSSITGPEIHATVRLHHLKAPRERHKGLYPGSGAKKIWKKGRLNGNAIISIFPYGLSKQGFPEKYSSRYAIPLRSAGKPSFKTSPQTRMIFCTVNVRQLP